MGYILVVAGSPDFGSRQRPPRAPGYGTEERARATAILHFNIMDQQ